MALDAVISILTAVGFGGVFGAWAKARLDTQANLDKKLADINEEKYRTILIYMAFVLSPSNRAHFIMKDEVLHGLKDEFVKGYSLDKVREYTYHSMLYASDEVIRSLRRFVSEPSRDAFLEVAMDMRKHLWGKETKLAISELVSI